MNQPQAVVYRGDFFSSLVGERVQRTVIPFAVLSGAVPTTSHQPRVEPVGVVQFVATIREIDDQIESLDTGHVDRDRDRRTAATNDGA